MEGEQAWRDGQQKKQLSISWFNSHNGAIEMVKLEKELGLFNVPKGKKAKKGFTPEERLDYYHERALKKYAEFYAKVISSVGNYKVEESLKTLADVKTPADLKKVWMQFSEDERHDPKIKEVVKALKEKFKNEKA